MRAASRGSVRSLVAAGAVVALAGSAWAQDYVKTVSNGLYETRPESATLIGFGLGLAPHVSNVQLPFTFCYYGTAYQSLTATSAGFLLARAMTSIPNMLNPTAPHGQSVGGGAFPYTQTGLGGAGNQNVDGLIAAYWSNSSIAYLYSWTTGTAPNRHVVFSWENVDLGNGNTGQFQAHLYEGTGRIVFAYGGAWTSGPVCVVGLDSPIDARFTQALATGLSNGGHPGADFVFDPVVTTYSGQLVYDRIVADAAGVGGSVLANQPVAGVSLELRRVNVNGATANFGTTAADGSFSINGLALPTASSGVIVAKVQNAACVVSPSATGATTSWTVASSLSFASGQDLGVRSVHAGVDPLGDLRAAIHVAGVCLTARDWVAERTSDAVPVLKVYVDGTNASPTVYSGAGANASLRVGSRQASNPDVWDAAVVTKAYARHVLASVSAPPSGVYDDRFDAVTDEQNAFAEGFGHWMWAAMTGATASIDATGPTAAAVYELEAPSITVAKGPAVAGVVAGVLHDLVDAANETVDLVDGRSKTGLVLEVAAAMTTAPTVSTFTQAWVAAGQDGPGIVRLLIGETLIADDALEPNDFPSEASPLGVVGFRRTGFALNELNEDWYAVTLPTASAVAADVTLPAPTVGVTVDVRDVGGALLATGRRIPLTNVFHVATKALPAGTYRIGVRALVGGGPIAYELQAYAPISISEQPLHDWTVGRVYESEFGVTGGISPYALSTPSSYLPPGIALEPLALRATGRPTAAGVYSVTLEVRDDGSPQNGASRFHLVTIHDVLSIRVAEFIAFPAGRAIDSTIPTTGGTPPRVFALTSGALPSGLALDAASPRVVGTAAAGPSTLLTLDGVDVAGSAAHVVTRAVVAVELAGRNVPADLAAGEDACGWWFDAVKGSTVAFSVATERGAKRRALAGVLLAPDRGAVTGGVVRARAGALAATKFVCPTSGRYCFVASSTSGDATRLLGTLAVKPPRSGKGAVAAFSAGDTTSFSFGALPGSTLVVKFGGDKRRMLSADVVAVLGPTGAAVPFVHGVKPTATGGTLTLSLAAGGTWTVVLGATSGDAAPGKLSWSYVVKPTKGAAYSDD